MGLSFGFLRDKERWVSEEKVRSMRRRETAEMILSGEAIDGKLWERKRARPWADLGMRV